MTNTSATGSGLREWLLFRRCFERGRNGEVADLGGELVGLEPGAGGEPVLRGELEVAVARPVGQDAE